MNLPSISIIIPTLNSSKTIKDCLSSILIQDYPIDKLEILISDGGSTDDTITIVKARLSSVAYKILDNPFKTGEAGKAVAVKQAKNEIIALIDSDNILPQKDWFKRMAEPFSDSQIIASEPLNYTYRPNDGYITRYCALLGMNDPLCFFLGNYDRYCTLTGKWTELPHEEEDKGDYLKVGFANSKIIPTIGANGFCIKRYILFKEKIGDHLYDLGILQNVLENSINKIAKVKVGIIHIFSGTTKSFIRKQMRRIQDYNYYKSVGLRNYDWNAIKKVKIYRFIFNCVIFYPLFIQSIRGYFKKKDSAWFYHPIACLLTCFIYGIGTIRNLLGVHPKNRAGWEQG